LVRCAAISSLSVSCGYHEEEFDYALIRTCQQIDQTIAVHFSFPRMVLAALSARKSVHIDSLNGVIQDFVWFRHSFAADCSKAEMRDWMLHLSSMKNMSLLATAAASFRVQHPLGALPSPNGASLALKPVAQ
jgi:hypothetical protein